MINSKEELEKGVRESWLAIIVIIVIIAFFSLGRSTAPEPQQIYFVETPNGKITTAFLYLDDLQKAQPEVYGLEDGYDMYDLTGLVSAGEAFHVKHGTQVNIVERSALSIKIEVTGDQGWLPKDYIISK